MRPHPLSYYHDEKFENRVIVNEEGKPIIDWGETIPGQIRMKTLFVKNETKDRIVIRQPWCVDEDLSIIDYPPRLFGEQAGIIKLKFAPAIHRTVPLNSEWGFDVVIG